MRNNDLIADLTARVAEDRAYLEANPTAVDRVLRECNIILAEREIAAQEALDDA